jgi:hypothetical protein
MVEHDYFFKLLTNLVKAAMHVIYLEENLLIKVLFIQTMDNSIHSMMSCTTNIIKINCSSP